MWRASVLRTERSEDASPWWRHFRPVLRGISGRSVVGDVLRVARASSGTSARPLPVDGSSPGRSGRGGVGRARRWHGAESWRSVVGARGESLLHLYPDYKPNNLSQNLISYKQRSNSSIMSNTLQYLAFPPRKSTSSIQEVANVRLPPSTYGCVRFELIDVWETQNT